MRKIIITAAIAVCMAVPGMASANLFVAAPVELAAPGIDQQLLESILRSVEVQTDYSYGCLCDMYAASNVEIGKNQDGTYLVSIRQADGGILDIILGDII